MTRHLDQMVHKNHSQPFVDGDEQVVFGLELIQVFTPHLDLPSATK
jgi:hypothetical protein